MFKQKLNLLIGYSEFLPLDVQTEKFAHARE